MHAVVSPPWYTTNKTQIQHREKSTNMDTTAEQEASDAKFEREVTLRVDAALAKLAEAEAAARGDVPDKDQPAWYPTPDTETYTNRTFPRGTTVDEVIEYDRLQAEARLAAGRTV